MGPYSICPYQHGSGSSEDPRSAENQETGDSRKIHWSPVRASSMNASNMWVEEGGNCHDDQTIKEDKDKRCRARAVPNAFTHCAITGDQRQMRRGTEKSPV